MVQSSFNVKIKGKRYSFLEKSYWIRDLKRDLDFVDEVRKKIESLGFSNLEDKTGYNEGIVKDSYMVVGKSGHFLRGHFSFENDDHPSTKGLAYFELKGLEEDVKKVDEEIGLSDYAKSIWKI